MVQEKVKEYFGKAKAWWAKTAKKTKIILAVSLLAILAVIGIVIAIMANRPYEVLFTGLTQDEMSEIVSYISDNGVTDYRIEGQDTILVPEEQEAQVKADLIVQGYPNTGYGYSTYLDNVGALTTESERDTLFLLSLQDEIKSVIRCFDGVYDARVNITPQEDNTYILDSDNMTDASAAVFVTMKDGKTLTENQVSGIRNYVSRAVKGLTIDNITITDSYGNTYSSDGTGVSDVQDISKLKMQLEEQVNNNVRTHIMQVLFPLFGEDNVKISVNSVVDVDRKVVESTNYSTEDWAADGSTNGEGIVGSVVYDDTVVRGEDTQDGGVAGTSSNSDLNQYVQDELQTDGNEQMVESSGQKDYLVDQENQQIEHLAGTVSDIMVSVTINQDAAQNVNLDELYSHIGRAAGITSDMQTDKISVLVAPFYQENTTPVVVPEFESNWMLYAVIGAATLFILLLMILLLVFKRHSRKKQAAGVLEAQASATIPEPSGADIMEMNTQKSMELRKEVRRFAETNPEIAAQMVKNWLREGDDTE